MMSERQNGETVRTVTVLVGYGYIGLDIVCGTTPVFNRAYKTWRPVLKTLASFDRQRIPYTFRVRVF